ncbi:MAG: Fe-S cluster assembly ATPase SufC [Lachnospiraceae bacterium]|nr:Fe-S cluster assembly ATPase SufC [Lachnospiraceae bacterium]
MAEKLIRIENIRASVGEEEILKDVSLQIAPGETHVLMGPNGAGKSTLGNVLMGSPVYQVTSGKIFFGEDEITKESADKRAQRGMFLSFQNPLEVPGLSLDEFIRNALRQKTGKPIKIFQFKKQLAEAMELLGMDESYASRDLNVGFSGGEKKKAEILQLLMLQPEFAILDETDSGLDVDAVRMVSKGIEEYQKRQEGALLIITHSTRILESLKVDYTHIIVKGKIVKTGGPELVDQINENGFEAFL